MTANIKVIVQVRKYPSKEDVVIVMPISEDLVYEAFEKLDLPEPNASSYERMLCTSSLKIELVKAERKHMAKVLTENLVEALMNAMGYNDTVMGYPKEAKEKL